VLRLAAQRESSRESAEYARLRRAIPPYAGFVIACEAIFGAPDERLTIRHHAGSSAAPYVAGTLLAVRRVGEQVGLRRGLDGLL